MNVKEKHPLNSYYRAVQIVKSQNKLLSFLVIILVITNIVSLYLSYATAYVSVPGQTISVQRSFTDPYLNYNAEMHTVNFIESMFSFEPSTFESNIDRARNWADQSVFDQFYNFYYVDKQQETEVPIYYTWVENNVLVDIKMDSMKSHFNDANEVIVEFYGKQIFKKSFDYNLQTVTIFNAAAIVEPLSFRSEKNRMGLLIKNLVVESKAIDE
ncbi:hypothetical protein [Chondrinema litorale]|uniref:hypothetical protein n=1 Tax=Chondrinema litorale TaxID=2994555 RepID=UPI0025427B92|nr:hypothetical protein [Chondrinema litorale]UZR98992.1 hypothetical protein OQ292_33890 [Chondrinema litorale]